MNNYNKAHLREFFQSIPQEEAQQEMIKERQAAEREHELFVKFFNKQKCSNCKHSLNSFLENEPCLHWLLLPNRIKKKALLTYLKSGIGFYRVQAYLRWVANTDGFMRNINDLKEEAPDNVILLETIRYKNLEWTLQIGKTDLEGHNGTQYGNFPHYHLQVLRDGRPYIKFNDCHIPLSDEDIFKFACLEQAGDLFSVETPHGEGISEVMNLCDKGYIEELDNCLKIVDKESESSINRQTVIEANPDKPISGELIYEAIEESKKTKEPIGKILMRKDSCKDMKFTTILSPSENVPELKKRTQRKSSKKK